MPVTIPIQDVITPLTAEAFGQSEPFIIGQIDRFTYGMGHSAEWLGRFLSTDGGRRAYSHPTLFAGWQIAEPTYGWVRIELDRTRGMLRMRPHDHFAGMIVGEDVYEAPAAALGAISLDAALLLATQIAEQGGLCKQGDDCRGARGRRLELRRSVLYASRFGVAAVCRPCFRGLCDLDSSRLLVIINGVQLPVHAPVPYLSAP